MDFSPDPSGSGVAWSDFLTGCRLWDPCHPEAGQGAGHSACEARVKWDERLL